MPFLAVLGGEKVATSHDRFKFGEPTTYTTACTEDYSKLFLNHGCTNHHYHKIISKCKISKDYKAPGPKITLKNKNVACKRFLIRKQLNDMVSKFILT